MYEGIADCLEKISSNRAHYDAKTVTEANGLLMSICSSKWIVGIQVYLKFSGYLKSLSQLLQGPAKDVMIAYEKVNVVIDELESIRKNSDETFIEIWNEAQKMAEQTCSELKRPRSCSRQTSRSNVDAESTEEFYKRSVFIPYLDHLISELKSRFTTTSKVVWRSLGLIPAYLE
jgi:ribosomal protein S8